MNPALNAYLAHELINDQIRQAERYRRGREQARPEPVEPYGSVTVRHSRPADEPAVRVRPKRMRRFVRTLSRPIRS